MDTVKGERAVEFYRWFLCFVIFSCVGWMYESAYYTIQQRRPVNSGFLNGCICPIYGIGGLIILIFLGKIQNPAVLFMSGMVLTCALEYFVSWLLEKLFQKRWWDYTGWPLNINGRVCIVGGVVFGIMSVMEIKLIVPVIFGFIGMIPSGFAIGTAIAIGLIILADIAVTIKHSDNFADKLWYVREQTKLFEEDGMYSRMISAANRRLPFHTEKGELSQEMKEGFIERIKRFLHID